MNDHTKALNALAAQRWRVSLILSASGNFPALIMSMLWKRFTTNGAIASMLVGTFSSLLLIYLSPTIQITILKHAPPLSLSKILV
ncbi:MAG: hypothetical protein ACK4ZH_03560 [Dolichospermum sp.]|jgi:Na+(H+)/acetate symporter ActP